MGMFLLLGFGFLITMLRAKVLLIMWGWFLIPVGAPPVAFGTALGVMFMWGMINGPSWEDLKDHDLGESFMFAALSVFLAVFTLGTGWLIKTAMLTG